MLHALRRCGVRQRKSQPLIHEIQKWPAREIAAEVRAKEVGHIVGARRRLTADVGRDDHIRQIPQAAFGWQRLGINDIDPRAAQVTGFDAPLLDHL